MCTAIKCRIRIRIEPNANLKKHCSPDLNEELEETHTQQMEPGRVGIS
jgi:hypothetical protein